MNLYIGIGATVVSAIAVAFVLGWKLGSARQVRRHSHTQTAQEKGEKPTLPTIAKRVLGVPWHQEASCENGCEDSPTRLWLGGYVTEEGGLSEEHALIHTAGIADLPVNAIVMMRINSACYTGDIFRDALCDCNWQLQEAVRLIEESKGPGLIIYHFSHEGKAHGWVGKLEAFRDKMFAVNSDRRDFRAAIAILRDLGITRVFLITNNPEKRDVLERHGIEVVGVQPVVSLNPVHQPLLQFKRNELGHMIPASVVRLHEAS